MFTRFRAFITVGKDVFKEGHVATERNLLVKLTGNRIPGFPWESSAGRLLAQYESYVGLVLGQWTQLKIEVKGKIAKLYFNGAEKPTLIVNDLKHPLSNGGIALWADKEPLPFCGPRYQTLTRGEERRRRSSKITGWKARNLGWTLKSELYRTGFKDVSRISNDKLN